MTAIGENGASPPTVPPPGTGEARRHGSPFCRWRHFDMNRRRREHAERKALHPTFASEGSPCDFGLDAGELRDHANELVQIYHWTVDEVLAVLDVQRRALP